MIAVLASDKAYQAYAKEKEKMELGVFQVRNVEDLIDKPINSILILTCFDRTAGKHLMEATIAQMRLANKKE